MPTTDRASTYTAKKSPRLELAETAFYTTPDKEAEGYGCDILWAGNSIGAGSFRAVAPDGTLFATDSVAARTQRVIASGPVRSIVEVSTPRWKVNGREYDMTQRYTIWAGHRDIEVDISGLYGAPTAHSPQACSASTTAMEQCPPRHRHQLRHKHPRQETPRPHRDIGRRNIRARLAGV